MAQPEGLVDADATLVEEDAAEEQADVELCFRFATWKWEASRNATQSKHSRVEPGFPTTSDLSSLSMFVSEVRASRSFMHSRSSQPAISVCRNLPKQYRAMHCDGMAHVFGVHTNYKRNEERRISKWRRRSTGKKWKNEYFLNAFQSKLKSIFCRI